MYPKIDRCVFRDLNYGLYIVTSKEKDRMNGHVVKTVIQITSEPPRIAVIINENNVTYQLSLFCRN